MRIIIIFFLLLPQSFLFAQNCDSEICLTILNLKHDVSKEQLKRISLNKKFDKTKEELNKLKKDTSTYHSEIRILKSSLAGISEDLLRAKILIENLSQELNNVIQELKNKKDKSIEEQFFLDGLLSEMQEKESIIEGVDGIIQEQSDDIEKLIQLNTVINNVEIGFQSNGVMTVIKKYKDGEDYYVSRLFKDLNMLNYSGDIYVLKKDEIKKLKGKILIYADNDLITTADANLTKSNNKYNNLIQYGLNSKSVKLDSPFPKGRKLRIGYVDNKTYYDNENYFKKFWDAQNENLFTVTNLAPFISEFSKETRALIEECKVVKNKNIHDVNSEILYISLRDYHDVDNDIVAIYVNGVNVLELTLENGFSLERKIFLNKGINKIVLVPISEGSIGSCTVELSIHEPKKKAKNIKLSGTLKRTECIEIIRH